MVLSSFGKEKLVKFGNAVRKGCQIPIFEVFLKNSRSLAAMFSVRSDWPSIYSGVKVRKSLEAKHDLMVALQL